MKKTFTKLAIALTIATTLNSQAQTTVSFDTFTLSANSYYQDNSGADFSSGVANFQYDWQGYWANGTAYTNVNDTVNGTYTNLYGAITGTSFSGTNYATTQSGAVISFSNNTTAVHGFYVTNTTYAWKVIKSGNAFSRAFGDTTGTNSAPSIPQGTYPDWFKLSVLGYRSGTQLTDTVHFYLADYRAAGTTNDYIVKNWQYVNCISLGQVDSIKFEMTSSDTSGIYLNTPAFFSMDNFVTQSTVGVEELSNATNLSLFPNPANQYAILNYESNLVTELNVTISDITGKEIQHQSTQTSVGNNTLNLNIEALESGVYFVSIRDGKNSKNIKLIKL
ncbi:MAG: DUF4465 domain-containing protein [Bacteroidetes bacterium]|nr:DUF4465 domain-containing protein [Bacteroidota bacterium]